MGILFVLRTNKLSSFITHQLSGFDKCLGGAYETDKIVTGGQKNEICGSVWLLEEEVIYSGGGCQAVGSERQNVQEIF